jgi:S-adenosylmethionine/arginine decarboxylase-like enzyme
VWHRFDDTPAGPGGLTALYLLSESHLALHTWPERGALLLSVCCCRPMVPDDIVRAALARHLEPTDVRLARHERGAR